MKGSSSKFVLGIYGAGGFAREVMPFARNCQAILARSSLDSLPSRQIYFVETHPQKTEINGTPLISEEEFFSLQCDERLFNVAIADSKVRERIANECISKGARSVLLSSPQSTIYDENEIGEGAILCANSMITSNAKIGRFFHSNI